MIIVKVMYIVEMYDEQRDYKIYEDILKTSGKVINPLNILDTYMGYADTYYKTKNYTSAINYYKKALVIIEKFPKGNQLQRVLICKRVGNVYDDERDLFNSRIYLKKVLQIRKK